MDKNSLIGVIGCGAMGSGIAQVAATAGHKVIVYDSNQNVVEKAASNLKTTLNKLVEKGKFLAEEASCVFGRVLFTSNMAEFYDKGSSYELIIEAIIENLDAKQNLFSALEKNISERCVLATNTSSLSVTSIASACVNPSRIIGIHFFNPAPLMPLVEIIPGICSDKNLHDKIKALMIAWGKSPVIAKDTPGFIVNRVARPFYGEALRIYEEGFADFATIDWAMKEFGGFKMGPFELMDLIGNDVNYAVTENVWRQFYYDPRYKPSFTQKRLVEAKLFGRKSGRGYYNYTSGAIMPEPIRDKKLGEYIFWRILVMLINEAADALYYGVASKEDLDIAMVKGVNYPKGLLRWADEKGIDLCLQMLEELYAEYREDRYRPSVMIKKMVLDGKKKFYS